MMFRDLQKNQIQMEKVTMRNKRKITRLRLLMMSEGEKVIASQLGYAKECYGNAKQI